jgi:hypothetical protein
MHRMESLMHDEIDPQIAITSLVNKMVLRARLNNQRFPEVWIFWSDLSEEELMQAANDNPQMMANLIRKNGHKVFDTPKEKSVIE